MAYNRSRGRRPSISTRLEKALCDLLRLGMPDAAACEAAGIPPSTYYRWRANGEEAHELRAAVLARGDEPPAESSLVRRQRRFFEATTKARAAAQEVYLGRIAAAAAGRARTVEVRQEIEHVHLPDGGVERRVVKETRIERQQPPAWQAAAWILERRHPGEFGRKERLEVTEKGTDIERRVNVGAAAVSDPVVSAAVDRLLAECLSQAAASRAEPRRNPPRPRGDVQT